MKLVDPNGDTSSILPLDLKRANIATSLWASIGSGSHQHYKTVALAPLFPKVL